MVVENEGEVGGDGRAGHARQRWRSLLGVRVKLLTGRYVRCLLLLLVVCSDPLLKSATIGLAVRAETLLLLPPCRGDEMIPAAATIASTFSHVRERELSMSFCEVTNACTLSPCTIWTTVVVNLQAC